MTSGASTAIPDCPYDVSLRHPFLRELDGRPPADLWRALKGPPDFLNGYRRFFYRYRTFTKVDWLKDIAVEGKLYLSSPDAFNDPFDMVGRVVFEGTASEKREELERKAKENLPHLTWRQRRDHVDSLMVDQLGLTRAAEEAYGRSRTGTGVCSFSEDPTNILLWSHYAADHKGVCFQFDVAHSARKLLAVVRVQYSEEFPLFNFAKPSKPQLLNIMLQKACYWSYERERRLVCPESANTNYRFEPSACTAAIIGCRTPRGDVAALHDINAARTARGINPLKLFQALPSRSKYRLKIVPLRLALR